MCRLLTAAFLAVPGESGTVEALSLTQGFVIA